MTTTGQILKEANSFERALSASRFYPLRHMAPRPHTGWSSWQNDGQNFIFSPYDGLWRTWALGNPDWKPNYGFPQTSWIEYAGPSLDQMVPVGTRIDRALSPVKSFWSGSCFVDWHNRLGQGYGSAWYYLSGRLENGLQAIELMTAPALGTDPHSRGIVITNEDVPDGVIDGGRNFRDCRVIWDDAHDQLILSATAGEKFCFFASSDGVSWRYLSALSGPGPLVECPNMINIPVRDSNGLATGASRWAILGAVQGPFPNGSDSGECCTVWVGTWDGTTFTPDPGYPLPIDYGPDSYATTAGTDHLGRPYVGYWLGNWNYCGSYTPFTGFQNIQGLPRQCWLQPDHSGTLRLFSAPLKDDLDAYSQTHEGTRQRLDIGTAYAWPAGATPTGKCARVDVTLWKLNGAWPARMVLSLRTGTKDGTPYHTDLMLVDGAASSVTLDRSSAGPDYPGSNAPIPTAVPPAWSQLYTIPKAVGVTEGDTITVSVLLDSCSLEAFFNGGLASMAALIFPPDECQGLSLTTTGPVTAQVTIHHY